MEFSRVWQFFDPTILGIACVFDLALCIYAMDTKDQHINALDSYYYDKTFYDCTFGLDISNYSGRHAYYK